MDISASVAEFHFLSAAGAGSMQEGPFKPLDEQFVMIALGYRHISSLSWRVVLNK